ncbi:Cysteine rich receptor like kinase [Trema orientale]|uniref:non-specific serine/threonine protein kinase n=1 Tax=Trema orientale TaxID=63057 RepID=A0A2P5EIE3_TREOI|nr:Cysteine rich receptor like kinase [Trema orientale]
MISSLSNGDPLFTFCSPEYGNYTPNSQFEANLKNVLDDLSSNITRNISLPGFFNTSRDSQDQRVYGQALCRGDVNSTVCQKCVENASQDIFRNCSSTDAMIWYEFCQVRYSFQMFFSTMVYTGKFPNHNVQEKNVSDQIRFSEVLVYLMNELSNETAFNSSKHMFATGRIRFSRKETIYGLLQCTRDINPESCKNCLDSALGDLNACCSFRQGGIVVSRNCNVRFELYQFYNDTSNSLLTYPFSKGHKWKIWKVVVATCTSILVLTIIIGSCTVYLSRRKETERDDRSEHALLQELARPVAVTITQEGNLVTSEELPFFDLTTIRAATGDFADSNMLGQGGFGTVYKGELPNGKEVAVKRLSRKSWQGLEEFKNEVILIAKLQHRNLVRLVGWGIEGEEKLLLYEFMPNRSLDFFIFDSERRSQLNWEAYYNIISGIAKGLLYLHEDSRHKIIHRDLKPSNVLLDHDMAAKISDFGMARIFCENQNTAKTKRVVGTYGYMAPEYAMGGMFSVKSDIFSFGVILLEIISGKKNSGFYLTEHAQTLPSYAWRLWRQGKELEFVDPLLIESTPTQEIILRCILIGLLCVQEDPEDRPTMSNVISLLQGSESISLSEPKQPAFAVGRVVPSDQSTTDPTLNGLTVSAILAR